MNIFLKNLFRFIVLVLIQVLVLNEITIQWWTQPDGFPVFIPYIYPLFILLLPFETPVWMLLFLGFILGLTMDSFMNTAGMHAAATVLLAYARPNVLRTLLPKDTEEYARQIPGVKTMGWVPFGVYCAFLILLHHTLFFTVELWDLSNISYLLLKIVASALTTLSLILVYILLFSKQATRR